MNSIHQQQADTATWELNAIVRNVLNTVFRVKFYIVYNVYTFKSLLFTNFNSLFFYTNSGSHILHKV